MMVKFERELNDEDRTVSEILDIYLAQDVDGVLMMRDETEFDDCPTFSITGPGPMTYLFLKVNNDVWKCDEILSDEDQAKAEACWQRTERAQIDGAVNKMFEA